MRRRAFMLLLGGAAVAAPLRGVAAQNDSVRRIAVLMPFDEGDPEGRHRLEVLREALRQLGWSDGRNLRIDVRWLAGDPAASARDRAAELVRLKPEVVLTASTPAVAAMSRATSTIPIVFANVADPVGSGFVASLARPGGNVTGFANFDPAMASKWLELLKELAPATSRVLLLYNPETSPGGGVYFQRAFEAAGRSSGVTPVAAPVHDLAEIESTLSVAGDAPQSGLVAMVDVFLITHRDAIVALATRHRLPAIYPFREFAAAGGLLSYGASLLEAYRRSAGYVDRILRGAHPSELPVQQPTTFELVINLKAAKALGLAIPPVLLARADEVIE
jgi:putative ABC transport system substrate-binding protein